MVFKNCPKLRDVIYGRPFKAHCDITFYRLRTEIETFNELWMYFNDLFSLIPFWLVLKFVSTESRFELEPKTRYSKKKFPLLQIYSLVFNSHNLWQTSFLSLLFSIIQLYNTVKVYAVMSKKTIKSNLETINFWSL